MYRNMYICMYKVHISNSLLKMSSRKPNRTRTKKIATFSYVIFNNDYLIGSGEAGGGRVWLLNVLMGLWYTFPLYVSSTFSTTTYGQFFSFTFSGIDSILGIFNSVTKHLHFKYFFRFSDVLYCKRLTTK